MKKTTITELLKTIRSAKLELLSMFNTANNDVPAQIEVPIHDNTMFPWCDLNGDQSHAGYWWGGPSDKAHPHHVFGVEHGWWLEAKEGYTLVKTRDTVGNEALVIFDNDKKVGNTTGDNEQ